MMSIAANLPAGDPGLSLTEAALNHIRRFLSKMHLKSTPIGIRVSVKKAGCSGYEYILEPALADSQNEFDFVFTFEDITVLISQEIYLKFFKGGTVMDFRKEGIQEGLAFDNPNVGNECGCGESFTLKDET